MSNDQVQLNRYTLSCVTDTFGHRWWAPFDGPVVLDFPPESESCNVTTNDATTTMALADVERLLIEHELIDPARDDPARPVYPFGMYSVVGYETAAEALED